MSTSPRHRRRMVVNPRLQFRHVCGLVILACCNGLLLVAILTWLFVFHADGRMQSPLSDQFLWYSIFGVMLMSVVTIFWSLLHTRALAGLLHKTAATLQGACDGSLPTDASLQLRKCDCGFEDVQGALTAVVSRFRRTHEARQALEALEADLASGASCSKAAVERLQALRATLST